MVATRTSHSLRSLYARCLLRRWKLNDSSALTQITVLAGRNKIVPFVSASSRSRVDVINMQFYAVFLRGPTAVPAFKPVSLENGEPVCLSFLRAWPHSLTPCGDFAVGRTVDTRGLTGEFSVAPKASSNDSNVFVRKAPVGTLWYRCGNINLRTLLMLEAAIAGTERLLLIYLVPTCRTLTIPWCNHTVTVAEKLR